jgi:hypothetical protein
VRAVRISALAMAVALGGCAAGQYCDEAERLLSRNPHAALEYIGLALGEDPEYDRAHSIALTKLLKLIGEEHEAKVQQLKAAGAYELAVADCDRVAASAHLARLLAGATYQIPHHDHRAELSGLAAEKQYQLAVEHQAAGDTRGAAIAFNRALGFRTDYKDAKARRDQCLLASRVRLFVEPRAEGPDTSAIRAVADGIARAAVARGLQFLEFVPERTRASAVCVVAAETATFHDSDWQGQPGRNEVWVPVRDAQGRYVVDPATGQTMQEKKSATWTVFSRQVSYQVQFAFQVRDAGEGVAAPAGASSRSAGDQGRYAVWNGDVEAVPDEVKNLPNSPRQLKGRDVLAAECATGAIDELAHLLFLAYEK